jgi:hypothetical protein
MYVSMDEMSVSAFSDRRWRRLRRAVRSAPLGANDDQRIEGGSSPKRLPLFVIPSRGGDGLSASIRGHFLELADPNSDQGLAPTPDDLRTASIASDFAWFARRFLRDRGLDDYVSVTAWRWTSDGSPDVDGVDITLTVSEGSVPVRAMLTTALEREFAHKFRGGRVRFQVGEE